MAVDTANQNIKAQLDASNDHGTANVILGDFFKKGFESQFGSDFHGFDLIYDYTVSRTILKCKEVHKKYDMG